MRKFIKKFKNSIWGKILKVIFKLLWWAIEALIIFLAIIIITQRVTNDQKAFLGFRIYNVATGSMEPEYAVGDILISKEVEPNTIEVGDNIVYLGDEAGYAGKIITHTVIQIEQNEKGEYLFHTQGRANTIEDPIVHESQVYGTIVQNNVVLAWLCRILTNRYGLYFFVIVPIVLWFFIEFVKSQGEKIEQEREAERERKRLQEEKRARRERRRKQDIDVEVTELKEPKSKVKEKIQEEKEISEAKTKNKTKTQKTENTEKKTAKKTSKIEAEIETSEKKTAQKGNGQKKTSKAEVGKVAKVENAEDKKKKTTQKKTKEE